MVKLSNKFKQYIFAFLAGFTVIGWSLFSELPDGQFHLYFLNVGQGDAVYLKTPENHQVLIDAGPGGTIGKELSDVMPFFDRSIDMIISTHPDKDHIGGFSEILDKYEVENVLITGVNKKSDVYDEFLDKILLEKSDVLFAESEMDFKFGEVLIDVIYPFNQIFGESPKKSNDSAIATRVVYKDKVVLLTADLEEKVEKILVEKYTNLKTDIFKAGHHGSKTSSSEIFLGEVDPEVVVIQSGKNNGYGHPHKEVLERLQNLGIGIRRNDLEGTIEFVF